MTDFKALLMEVFPARTFRIEYVTQLPVCTVNVYTAWDQRRAFQGKGRHESSVEEAEQDAAAGMYMFTQAFKRPTH